MHLWFLEMLCLRESFRNASRILKNPDTIPNAFRETNEIALWNGNVENEATDDPLGIAAGSILVVKKPTYPLPPPAHVIPSASVIPGDSMPWRILQKCFVNPEKSWHNPDKIPPALKECKETVLRYGDVENEAIEDPFRIDPSLQKAHVPPTSPSRLWWLKSSRLVIPFISSLDSSVPLK